MATIDTRGDRESKPLWARYRHAPHFRSREEEFDAVKTGFWLFLSTEVLLFSGLFVAYAIFRMLYPEAFYNGSRYLDWKWGGLNTVLLLVSSYTMAAGVGNAQRGENRRMMGNLGFTVIAGAAFIAIKLAFEYGPKWAEGKRPGILFSYPFATDPHENLWWSVYYCATGLHALHVLIGMALIVRVMWFGRKGAYGPGHYTGVEIAGLYWHLVDLIWIFLFPLLYLIH
ncbi:MAG: cytochrome c oxidase subunit 3 family protein [Phycisphaerae bacterium]|nr:cytochrome c oxidase subunit 3 family protein [Phycisphaerae bacterium]